MSSLFYFVSSSVQIILFFRLPRDQFILFYKSECPLFYISVRRMSISFYFISPSVQIILFSSPPCDQFILFYKSESPFLSSPDVQFIFYKSECPDYFIF